MILLLSQHIFHVNKMHFCQVNGHVLGVLLPFLHLLAELPFALASQAPISGSNSLPVVQVFDKLVVGKCLCLTRLGAGDRRGREELGGGWAVVFVLCLCVCVSIGVGLLGFLVLTLSEFANVLVNA